MRFLRNQEMIGNALRAESPAYFSPAATPRVRMLNVIERGRAIVLNEKQIIFRPQWNRTLIGNISETVNLPFQGDEIKL